MNRLNIICLGVRNMVKAIKFYRDGLGFKTDEKGNNPEVVFFSTSGTKLELYPLELLAKDINNDNPPEICCGFGGITLAYNAKTKEEVREVIELARKAGQLLSKSRKTFFGVAITHIFQTLMATIGKWPGGLILSLMIMI